MSILGRFTQQPLEIDTYSISFIRDMAANDNLISTWTSITYKDDMLGDIVKTVPYTATLADTFKLIRTTSNVTLPVGAPDGYVQCVVNTSLFTPITVDVFTIPLRGSVIVKRVSGAWEVETSVTTQMIAVEGDQRVRVTVNYGVDGITYKTQTIVTTVTGRQLQDELLIKFKEA